ncbi:CoA transferase [Alkalicaulis satelles]|uniref:CoA transferase n=1 Tax=Alkalicaulis satelles TaxID=2609175 RepID=A0A5M6ZIY9_9PROT|nr:CoA transferase [Alkalicaulis satelles]KAA5803975.1 CoA transferase [Alkalicaulis satelles]
MHKPLQGLRILTIEQYGAGPYGTQLLAALGADVIKIENRAGGGDSSRAAGPHFLGAHDSQFFQTFNRGKKSVCLDLKETEDRALFEALVKDADAVANNLRGDLPAKLKVDYAALQAIKPSIVCAHLSAYGREGERAAWPGYDYLMQAEAGFLSLTGEPDGPPARFGLSMVDFMTGTMMALGLVSAVLGARRNGQGCDVDVSLLDTALHQLSYPATWHLNEGDVTTRLARSSHPSVMPSQLFPTRDGWIFLMCQLPKFWNVFCQAAGRSDLADHPDYADVGARAANRAALQDELDALFRTRTTADWMAALGGKVPVAPVHDIAAALDAPDARAMIETVEHPERPDGLKLLREPIRINGERPSQTRAPQLGEHDDAVLGPLRRGQT